MPLIALAGSVTPPVPPTPPPTGEASPWGELEVGWTGWDGSTWVLSSPESPVWLTPGGTRGLNMPPVDRFTSTSPAVAGARWRGYRVGERPVFWPLFLYGDSTAQWRDVDRAWWATMRPDAPGTWTIAQPDGTRRSLTCRYSGDNDHVFTRDPFGVGWVLYGIDLVAEEPFWRGDPIVRTFSAAVTTTPFYGGTGGGGFGPPLYITPSVTTATASIPNPGDEPAWPRWTIYGPCSSAVVGVGDQLVTVPFALVAGKSLAIDTRPDRLTVVDSDGLDRTGDLGAVSFAPVPPGAEVPLSITVPGSGAGTAVRAQIEPLYYRAW